MTSKCFGKLVGVTTAWERLLFSPVIKGRLMAHNSQIARSNNTFQQLGGRGLAREPSKLKIIKMLENVTS